MNRMIADRMLVMGVLVWLLAGFASCTPKRGKNLIQVRTNITGAPIEKYIYGQFIEHLGKCIYGGMWAEMLEDRKFYYPVTDEFNPWAADSDAYWGAGKYIYLNGSPWEVMGGPETVEMDTRHPFCGQQSVKVIVNGDGLPCGFRQARLHTLAGRKYTGYLIAKGEPGVLPLIVQLTSSSGDTLTHKIEEISHQYTRYNYEFNPDFSSQEVSFEVFSKGKGDFYVGTSSLMPADHIKGWRADVIELLKELNAPVYRWPGGNFVSGYNWMDGIGERDTRPPRKNPAWKGVESNDVGIHEYMELMEILGSEAFIAVNTGLGTIEEVTNEIAYCNGPANGPMGMLRAANGHAEPYGVKWWAVGNEMYGSWQLGHMPLSQYVKKHNEVARAIWKVDPQAHLIGVGSVGEWSRTMLTESADFMNLISEHIYCRELDSLPGHIGQLAASIRGVADAHRTYRDSIPGLAVKNIRIAMDEWNYWYGDYIYGELGVEYHQKDALGVAKGLHEFFRNSDLFFMANYAQTVNVIGCIKTTPTAATFSTTGLPLILYRKHFGSIPLLLSNNLPGVDIAAAVAEDRKKVTIACINETGHHKVVFLSFEDAEVSSRATKWVIQHPDPEISNEPGKAPNVFIEETDFAFRQRLKLPPYSISLFSFDIKMTELP